ncbi:vWA-like protein [Gonapodya prolifera JEL478]|uniref:VWA-like protein n=1 Tax=Gonapodya prolifera (strain JEL478) TaxID=1344416 RepID=A0A139B004_GONPJ|nr:vWA-like protein [Gonapodya prolifera JEL478]|eukprot:KXS22321.1 vWA-like protein [Gonapodya prolifera JEL478]
MNAMANLFNSQNNKSGNKVIYVNITISSNLTDSGKPDAWTPANYLWVQQEYTRRSALNAAPIKNADVYAACPSTTTTPLGILMWRTFATALGWPNASIGFRDILQLASAPDGWAVKNHPEWGTFKFGHGHPEYSNSGRLSILAAITSFTNLTQAQPLTTDLVTAASTVTGLKNFASSVYHMGTNDQALLSLMLSKGTNYLHGMTTYESVILSTNTNTSQTIAEPVDFIYLSDGTFWQEHPYCVLDNMAWNTPEKIDGATQFLTFLRSSTAQARLPEFGLRPLASLAPNGSAGVTDLICNGAKTKFSTVNGVDCRKNQETIPLLQYPNATVMNTVVQTWYTAKKPVTVALVIDVSGSMGDDGKIGAARAAATLFINQLRDTDVLYLITFSTNYTILGPNTAATSNQTLAQTRSTYRNLVGGLVPNGNTALYDTVVVASQLVSAVRTNDKSAGLKRNYAVVLMTDGMDTTSVTSAPSAIAALPDGTESDQLHMFSIGFGTDADTTTLGAISKRTNAFYYPASTTDIAGVYFAISLEF